MPNLILQVAYLVEKKQSKYSGSPGLLAAVCSTAGRPTLLSLNILNKNIRYYSAPIVNLTMFYQHCSSRFHIEFFSFLNIFFMRRFISITNIFPPPSSLGLYVSLQVRGRLSVTTLLLFHTFPLKRIAGANKYIFALWICKS